MGMNFNIQDFSAFVGGWSYRADQLFMACECLQPSINEQISVLEFGCGDSTVKLFNILKSLEGIGRVVYDCYESNPQYTIKSDEINCILYDETAIDGIILPNRIYDLILVDGPNGVNRSKWYSKIKDVIAPNSVIVIDDYDHFKEFEEALCSDIGSVWEYEEDFVHTHDATNKNWKTVRILNNKESADDRPINL